MNLTIRQTLTPLALAAWWLRGWGCALGVLAVVGLLAGCTPRQYRQWADRQAYGIIEQNTQRPMWWTPPFSIEAPPESRNHDPYPPDAPPMPPDDPAAHEYMHDVGGHSGYKHWHRNGDAEVIESPCWLGSTKLNDDGELELDRERAVELSLLNSREYQFQLENLYLAALGLSLERFAFNIQFFGVNSTHYEFQGSRISGRGDQSSTLTTRTNLGFARAFTAGGQLLVDVANTFVWEFSGADDTQAMSSISVGLVQPLLRGAFRDIRLEPLTQSERSMLYSARDYARFRKQFYFDVVSGDTGYLALLLQLQAIRNLEANLTSLERNLREHEALAAAGIVSPLQVDQVFQSYQSGRLQLIRARNQLQNDLDLYKIRLGIPPELEARLDDSLLAPFELNSKEIVELQSDLEKLLATYRELDTPPETSMLGEGWQRLRLLSEEVKTQHATVQGELERWSAIKRETDESDALPAKQEQDAQKSLKVRLDELRRDLAETDRLIDAAAQALTETTRRENWEAIQTIARRASSHTSDLFVIQSQIRTFLIELEPSNVSAEQAIPYALDNRLDLMNQRAAVVDAWRHVHVAENALRANVDVFADTIIGTTPGSSNPFNFSTDASRARVGVRFDSPLNRFAERNTYRAEQIEYQRARRAFIARRDEIVRAVRFDLRQLNADQINFEIARQSLIVAARQVELAEIQLRAPRPEGDSSPTQDALNALNSLLQAKNNLIAVWVSYETNRLRLLLDTEALQLDERGFPQDDDGAAFQQPESIPPGPAESVEE